MITVFFISLLLLLGALILVVGVVMAWALAEQRAEDDAKVERKPGKIRRILTRFWTWANAVPPRLEYRRDKKGRFRKLKRW